MTTVYKYRLWCETESTHVYTWDESEPSVCPNNSSHSIDVSRTTIDAVVGEDRVDISDHTDEQNRPYIRAESRDVHDNTYFTTRGDGWGIESGTVIGTGDGGTKQFKLPHQEVRSVQVFPLNTARADI